MGLSSKSGVLPLLIAVGVVTLLGGLSLSFQMSSQIATRRIVSRIDRREAFYSNELAAWHAYARATDTLTPGATFVVQNGLLRRYTDGSVTYRTPAGAYCGSTGFGGTHKYHVCLNSAPPVGGGMPDLILAWSNGGTAMMFSDGNRLWFLGITKDGKLVQSFGEKGLVTHKTLEVANPRMVGYFDNTPCKLNPLVCPMKELLVFHTLLGTRFYSARTGAGILGPDSLLQLGPTGTETWPTVLFSGDMTLLPTARLGAPQTGNIVWGAWGDTVYDDHCSLSDCAVVEIPNSDENMLAWRIAPGNRLRIYSKKGESILLTTQFPVGSSLPPNNHLDNSFGTNGMVETVLGTIPASTIRQASLMPNGRPMVLVEERGGYNSSTYQWEDRIRAYLLTEEGRIDPNYGNSGSIELNSNTNEPANGLQFLTRDGELFNLHQMEGMGTAICLQHINTDGTVDTAFGNSGTASFASNTEVDLAKSGRQIVRDSSGSIYLAIQTSEGGPSPPLLGAEVQWVVYKFSPNGLRETGFGNVDLGYFHWRSSGKSSESIVNSEENVFGVALTH
ncbi:MAG: hypothetical protein HYR96_01170 [Deltaproteobacteria bacterium]|nr:hypothetical protein [Deltaproteobacteria bacterium]MBI3296480.1 hypothetical protein [Deltaproteobacteria bacterium]